MNLVLAAIATGSNLGRREAHLLAAERSLGAHPEIEVVARSTIIETAPVGPDGQGPYLNGALLVRTTLSARALLEHCLRIERANGRVRDERWGPRTLDLDLLLYGDAIIDEPGLRVPHPALADRRFVLEPLAEIAPEMVHPTTGKTIRALWASGRAGAVPPKRP